MLRAIKHIRSITTAVQAHSRGSIKESSAFKVFVTNLPWTVGNKELTNYFSKFGPVTEAVVVFNPNTGISQGYGFVTFQFGHAYSKAIGAEQHLLEGRALKVTEPRQ